MDKGKKQEFKGADLLEQKKSNKANLEQNRTTWLLIGFVLALVTLFAGLELTEFQEDEEQPAAKKKSNDDIIVVIEEIPPLVIEKASCGNYKRPHRLCPACGKYNGREVVKVEE